jgi:anti-sigma factor RsiW
MSVAGCGKLLLLQADLDGELDATAAAALAQHRVACPVCRRNELLILDARQALRGVTYHRAAPELRAAIVGRMGAERAPAHRWRAMPWRELASFGAGAVLAAAIILTVLPIRRQNVIAALIDDHVRALQPGHLLDVVSTDRHTVKPWFDGRLDFSPPVKDLAQEGFPLLGGRLDYLSARSVAVLVYSHGKHIVELFVWPAGTSSAEPAHSERDGYNIVHWSADAMSFSAVSDLEPSALEAFVREWRRAP